MSDTFHTEKLSVCTSGVPYVKQFTLDVNAPADGVAIAKVLSTPATVRVTDAQVKDGEVTFCGTLVCRVLYIDGEGARKISHSEVEFCERVAVDPHATQTIVRVGVLDVDPRKVATDSVTLRCALEAVVTVASCHEIGAVTAVGDDTFTQSGAVEAMTLVGATRARLIEEGSKELGDIEGDVLLCEAEVYVTDVTPRVDAFLLGMTIVTHALYRSTDGQLKRASFSTPVTDEVALGGLTANACVEAAASLSAVKHTLVPQEGGAPTLQCEWTVDVQSIAVQPVTYPVLTDAFHVTHELTVEKTEISACTRSFTRTVHAVDGSATLAEDAPACDAVLAVTGARINVANVFAQGGRVTVEGLLHCSVLYLNREYGTTNATLVEVPFSVCVGESAADTVYAATATVIGIDATTVRAGRLDVTADVAICLSATVCRKAACVTGITVGAARNTEGAGITVYIARDGESLWDVAKALCVTPEHVTALNPDVTFPVSAGQKIVLYRQLTAHNA